MVNLNVTRSLFDKWIELTNMNIRKFIFFLPLKKNLFNYICFTAIDNIKDGCL